jgi:hypothetical protein
MSTSGVELENYQLDYQNQDANANLSRRDLINKSIQEKYTNKKWVDGEDEHYKKIPFRNFI